MHEERLCRERCNITSSIAKSQNIAIGGCQSVELFVREPEEQGSWPPSKTLRKLAIYYPVFKNHPVL